MDEQSKEGLAWIAGSSGQITRLNPDGSTIDVTDNDEPIVANSSGHNFVRQSTGIWSEFANGLALGVGVGDLFDCDEVPGGCGSPGSGVQNASPLWVIGTNSFGGGDAVWNFSAGTWQQSQLGGSRITVDSSGSPWVVQEGVVYEGPSPDAFRVVKQGERAARHQRDGAGRPCARRGRRGAAVRRCVTGVVIVTEIRALAELMAADPPPELP